MTHDDFRPRPLVFLAAAGIGVALAFVATSDAFIGTLHEIAEDIHFLFGLDPYPYFHGRGKHPPP